jgi:putative DNA modification/repair radical SAM protein
LRLYSIRLYSASMDLGEKLEILAASARYDASCASSGSDRRNAGGIGAATPSGVCHSFTGDGRCVSLLKVLYSNSCLKDCAYCANRVSADIRRTSFKAEELARLTIGFYKRNYIEGLFLSSGIFSDPDIVMERLIEVARLLREGERFNGYIHLKAIPGCGDKLLRKAGLYADRLSANIELPTAASLARLAPGKSGPEILGAMRFMGQAEAESKEDRSRGRSASRSAARFAPAGQSTQLVVGASPDDDGTIVRLASSLYGKLGLRRVYYSAFVPVSSDPRLPALKGPPLLREHRLYQADWLLRFYGFKAEEIVGSSVGNLDSDVDPKTAWALRHPEFFPVELDRAEYAEILRVPGIGVTGAGRIVASRRSGRIRPEELPKMGIVMKRARWFLSSGGRPLYALDPRETAGPPDALKLRLLLADAPEDGAYRASAAPPRGASAARMPGQLEFGFA